MERTGPILQAIFDSTDDVWFFVTPDFKINYFNKKASQNSVILHGRELSPGDSILDFVRDTENNIETSFIDNFGRATSGELVREEKRIDYSSQALWFRSKYAPVYRDQNLLGVSILIEDISYQKMLEEQQRIQQEKIISLSKKQEEFVNIASHELKTPLTALKATFQMMERRLSNGATYNDIKRHFERSSISIEKLHLLIRDLLDVNKISNGSLVLDKSNFVISEMVNFCCEHISLGDTHKVTVSGDTGLQVYADRNKIEQVLMNFLNNAVKYATGSSDIHISIGFVGEFAKISVKDNGRGIPADKIGRLFERYYQVEDANRSAGLGLGLYIAEGIVKKHMGEIGVESTVGKGSTFWFTLPLKEVHN